VPFVPGGQSRAGEARGIPHLLLRVDPGEDAVEVLVLDDGAGIELRVVLGVETGKEDDPVRANSERIAGIKALCQAS